MAKLTKAQKELLAWLASQQKGVTDITDERLISRLIGRGLALKFFETEGEALYPVWTITEAGRTALASSGGGR